jgi:glutamate/tyrosine decarboxylase-like PLP-dependent enzyme
VLGLQHVRVLPGSRAHDWALQADTLAAAMAADREAGLLPFFFLGTIGTTSTCAVDPIAELAAVAAK